MSLAMFGIVANSASETQITNFPSVEQREREKEREKKRGREIERSP